MKIGIGLLSLMFVMLQYDLWIGEGSIPAMWSLQSRIDSVEKTNTRLHKRNDQLAAEVLDLKKGFAAIEERARNELGMVKKDETFIQIVEQP